MDELTNGAPAQETCEDPTCNKTIAHDPITVVDNKQLKHYFHPLCFWKARAQGFEQMYTNTHQAICAILCSKLVGGRIQVSKNAQNKAKELNFKMEVTNLPDESLEFKMAQLVVTLA